MHGASEKQRIGAMSEGALVGKDVLYEPVLTFALLARPAYCPYGIATFYWDAS